MAGYPFQEIEEKRQRHWGALGREPVKVDRAAVAKRWRAMAVPPRWH